MTLPFITLAILALYIALTEVRTHNLRKEIRDLKANLNENYWTKQTVARNYGEPPADKLEAEKKQDEQLKNLHADKRFGPVTKEEIPIVKEKI